MSIKSFNNWYTSVKESEVQAEVSQTTAISSDVDTIINSLETLASELTEELSEIEDEDQIEEGAGDFIKDWMASKKAAKSQQKVNKIKMNASDLQFAADKAKGDKKKSLEAKVKKAKEQGTELQTMVDDKFSGKGPMTDSKLSKEKIKGQVELIKRTTGMEDDPKKKADLKVKMKELVKKAQQEDAAMAELEDKNADAIAAEEEKEDKGENNETSQKLADEFIAGNEGFKVISAEEKTKTVPVKNEESGEEEDKPKYGDFKELKGKKEDGSADEPIIVAKEIEYNNEPEPEPEDNKTSQELADKHIADNEGFKVISAEDKEKTVPVKNEESGEEEDKPKYGDFKEFKGKKEDGSDDETIIVAKEIEYNNDPKGEKNETSQELADKHIADNEGFKVISAEDKEKTVPVKNEESGEEEDKPKYGDFKEFKGKKEDGSDDETIIVAKEISYPENNSLVIRAKAVGLNELALEIESKLDWQVAEGTILASNYNSIIKKSESDKILNESKYQVNSVKDAFRRLM